MFRQHIGHPTVSPQPYNRRVKVRDVIRRLEREGWVLARKTGGSHRTYTHPARRGAVVVSDHGTNADMKLGTYNAIAKAAGWKK